MDEESDVIIEGRLIRVPAKTNASTAIQVWRRSAVALLFLFWVGGVSDARHARYSVGEPGVFDYYLLTLSWSPEFCAQEENATTSSECDSGRPFGFLVHGLWPQYTRGYPSDCARVSPLTNAEVQSMLALMPSPSLVQHEWQKHGACSGLAADDYLTLIRKAYAQLQIPPKYKNLSQALVESPAQLKTDLVQANPGFGPDQIRIQCSGQYVSDVSFCLSKTLEPQACGSDVRDRCQSPKIILRPIRPS